jgi:uncharacterized protein (TIGR00255 family)
MTGFARAEGHAGGQSWTWEVKSVNGRGLDLRFRLPSGFDAIELPARRLAGERLKRGNVNINLQLGPSAAGAAYRVNRELLRELAAIAGEAAGWIDAAPPRLDGLLGLRGVIETVEQPEDEATVAAREAALLGSLVLALDRLVAARSAEGLQIASVLRELVDQIEQLVTTARASAAARPEALRARLAGQLAMLLDAAPPLPPERLAQELALQVTRVDVREELDRLAAHVAGVRELIEGGDAAGVGRRLDFLAQELNREANTLCSKSADVALTRIGLDLKLAIDRFREQVQNVE